MPSVDDRPPSPVRPPGLILKGESFWRDHFKWLESCGYKLRSRYAPDWVPSWEGTKKRWDKCEDGQRVYYSHIADAIRVSDGAFLSLKLIKKTVNPYETDIGAFFSSEPLASDPRNHCVPMCEVLQVPDADDKVIFVMPLLREYDNPRFDTIGEAVEFFRQIFEGLQFMHLHHVAHRDCNWRNVMMDATPLYPEPYHPRAINMKRDFTGKAKHYTRTQCPPKYYFIDFGIARRYNAEDGPPLEDPIRGGDKSVPEFQTSDDACDPFPTDVYYIGNLIRRGFLKRKLGFEFMRPLVADMIQDDPAKRPTMDEVVARYEIIRKSLSNWKLRSRVVHRKDNVVGGAIRGVGHWTRRIGFILRRIPPVPTV